MRDNNDGLPTPQEILKDTKKRLHNEVVVMGSEALRVIGAVAITYSDGKNETILVSKPELEKVERYLATQGLPPIVKIPYVDRPL